MRPAVLDLVVQAGLDPLATMTMVEHTADRQLKVQPASVFVARRDGSPLELPLEPLTALFVGDRQPPAFREEPPEEYLFFFGRIEFAAGLACVTLPSPVHDREFERVYRQLRRFPDGTDKNPLFAVLQQAAALHASLVDVSRAEYEAVMDRLVRSARTFHTAPGSTNYFRHILAPQVGASR